ncbi:MAG TPA: dTMP kinase [Sulfuricurvum sp.]|nr:dTMP kinase [Sulfuricurvum sp.]
MYLALEGIDTAGKSTQMAALHSLFPKALFTKEPGGTPTGEQIRTLLLETGVQSSRAELLLFLADRSEHIEEVVIPNRTSLIISDRSVISGMAYAMVKQAFSTAELLELNRFATGGIFPDYAVILKLTEAELIRRLGVKSHDAIEARGTDYLLAIQDELEHAATLLGIPTLVIDAAFDIDTITEQIQEIIITKGAS